MADTRLLRIDSTAPSVTAAAGAEACRAPLSAGAPALPAPIVMPGPKRWKDFAKCCWESLILKIKRPFFRHDARMIHDARQ